MTLPYVCAMCVVGYVNQQLDSIVLYLAYRPVYKKTLERFLVWNMSRVPWKITEVLAWHPATNDVMIKSNMAAAVIMNTLFFK